MPTGTTFREPIFQRGLSTALSMKGQKIGFKGGVNRVLLGLSSGLMKTGEFSERMATLR